MKANKIMGAALIILALAIVTGLVIDVSKYWYALDYVTILVCGISGLILLLRN